MKQEIKHTELPWAIQDTEASSGHKKINTTQDGLIAWVGNGERKRDTFEANAEFIVQAVNSHYELVRLLREALPRICKDLPKPMDAGTHEYLSVLEDEIVNAIKKAEGK